MENNNPAKSNIFTDDKTAVQIAKYLINIKAVEFNKFELASSMKSPVYIDCRKIISYVNEREKILDIWFDYIKNKDFDIIAGGESAGIPFASFLSHKANAPMIYIRKNQKNYGRNKMIEGDYKEKDSVILVEDLASTCYSKVNFINTLNDQKLNYLETSVIVFYNITKIPNQIKNISYMCDLNHIMQAAKEINYCTNEEIENIEKFISNNLAS